MSKPNAAAAVSVRIDSYNGSPIIVFGADPNPGRNFSFGKGKATLLLDAIASHGVDSILAMLSTVAGVSAAPAPAPAPSPAPAERADTATVTTPAPAPAPATAKPRTKPTNAKGESEAAERKRLIGIVKAAKVKGHGLSDRWSTDTLRTKAASLQPAAATTTPTVKASASAEPTLKERLDAIPQVKAETPAPSIVHRNAIDGRTYVLFSNGVTKQHYVRDGKDVYRKTSVKLVLPASKPIVADKPSAADDAAPKTVLRTFRDGSTQFVLYTDGTWKAVERVDRTV
jgi:hypothetical protein